MSNFLTSVEKMFKRARDIDTRYYRHLAEVGEAKEERQFLDLDPDFVEDTKISELIAGCHDGHQDFLLEEETKLRAAVEKWQDDFLLRFRKKERMIEKNVTR